MEIYYSRQTSIKNRDHAYQVFENKMVDWGYASSPSFKTPTYQSLDKMI
jgi:hypothetical protein